MGVKETEQGISILICTYNGAARLMPTLSALLRQENTLDIPWEVVLVDNASSDNTAGTARSIWNNSPIPFKIISELNPGRDNALRKGFQHVKYEFVCNVDDDTWVCNNYVSLVWEIMTKHPELAVCGGKGSGEFETEPPAWLKQFETALAIGPQGKTTGYVDSSRNYLYGACAVYRKSLWNLLKESDFKFFLSGRKGNKLSSGEDFELCQAWKILGYELYYDERINFKHFMPAGRLTWDYFRKLYKAFGRSDLVTQQYFKVLNLYSRHKVAVLNNYFLYLAYEVYMIIRKLPSYLTALLIHNTGNAAVLNTEREFALFFELLCNKRRYNDVKKVLAEAQWKNHLKIH
jgi:glycosyltransferase involved in cell wall biosynthesis